MPKRYGKQDVSKFWVLRNSKTGEVRVAMLLKGDVPPMYVTKFFRPADDLEIFSIKFFFGDIKQTISHWNTKDEISGKERDTFIALAFERINSFTALINS